MSTDLITQIHSVTCKEMFLWSFHFFTKANWCHSELNRDIKNLFELNINTDMLCKFNKIYCLLFAHKDDVFIFQNSYSRFSSRDENWSHINTLTWQSQCYIFLEYLTTYRQFLFMCHVILGYGRSKTSKTFYSLLL